ncbi:BgTH12-00900 [Blumeria graminis f. sp. triticale]|uniref:Bgt-4142 n=3 Tax=Blumeria graminis TaxID=34373 RepID=A0A061HK88_BLUGR|nr:Tryptophan-rich sensory protein TspO [Blumeria graminis f. sp. tritici 96224]CAD6505409.1 BgTH12-00900 [Blumeria graminis f. sp. triticale]VDB93502.1 Bgt-4142 [Blumeria graminis f. sp. tritici]
MTTFIPSITLPAAVFANPASSILLPVIAGAGLGYSMRPTRAQATYMALKQPPYRPPPYIFGPVWTILYGLMGYAAHRVYRTGMSPQASMEQYLLTKQGATLYTIQLGLNLIWMPLFFRLKRPVESLVDIIALTGTVGYLTYVWSRVEPVASWCLVPYCAWLGFATYLTAGVGYLNGWDLTDKKEATGSQGKHIKFTDEED